MRRAVGVATLVLALAGCQPSTEGTGGTSTTATSPTPVPVTSDCLSLMPCWLCVPTEGQCDPSTP